MWSWFKTLGLLPDQEFESQLITYVDEFVAEVLLCLVPFVL